MILTLRFTNAEKSGSGPGKVRPAAGFRVNNSGSSSWPLEGGFGSPNRLNLLNVIVRLLPTVSELRRARTISPDFSDRLGCFPRPGRSHFSMGIKSRPSRGYCQPKHHLTTLIHYPSPVGSGLQTKPCSYPPAHLAVCSLPRSTIFHPPRTFPDTPRQCPSQT
jgi:hypothetical protein